MKLHHKQTVFVGLAFMSICAFWQIYDNVVPLMLKNTFGLSDTLTGAVMGVDNILALVMLPLFGALSDQTKTRLGRRMPYILTGTVLASAAAVTLPLAERGRSLVVFMIALGAVLLSMASYRSPAVALMPDVTVKPLRSKGNAIINLMGALGGALMLLATAFLVPKDSGNYFPLFIALIMFMLLSAAVLFFTVNEPRAVAEMRAESKKYGIDEISGDKNESTGEKVRMEPAVKNSFELILASVFLWFMGYNAVTSGFTRYAENVWDRGVGSASTILLVAQVAAIAAYIPVGILATKIGRKKTILAGIVMLTAAFGSSVLFQNFSYLMFFFFALAGIGWAFINVNSYPMVVDMSKGSNIGRYTGYYYFFSMAAQSVTPALSGFFIDHFGYRTLFLYGAVFVALSFVTMRFVRHGDSRPEPKKTALESFGADD